MTTVQARQAGRAAGEQTRARYPDDEGHVERDGVRVSWERYGDGEPTVFLLPTWSIVHSRSWKAQIPYLARHFRVLTFDGRGNGRSDRPEGAAAYSEREFAADALAVLDATATERAVLVSLSCGALWSTLLAADHPGRVDGIVYIGPAVGLATPFSSRWTPMRDGPGTTGTIGCATTAASWSTSSRGASPSPIRPSSRRTASPGRWRLPPRP
jgi:pimeloyl-ACP methyl ester carboxylesterase